jgi:hypothetical protein
MVSSDQLRPLEWRREAAKGAWESATLSGISRMPTRGVDRLKHRLAVRCALCLSATFHRCLPFPFHVDTCPTSSTSPRSLSFLSLVSFRPPTFSHYTPHFPSRFPHNPRRTVSYRLSIHCTSPITRHSLLDIPNTPVPRSCIRHVRCRLVFQATRRPRRWSFRQAISSIDIDIIRASS